MKTKKKIFVAVMAVLLAAITLSAVWYFSPKTFLSGVAAADVTSISVFDGNTGNRFVIEKPEEIRQIVENIQAIPMKRDSLSVGLMGYSFRMQFTDKNGKVIDSFILNGPGTIRDDPFFYRCDSGLCYDYMKELEGAYVS